MTEVDYWIIPKTSLYYNMCRLTVVIFVFCLTMTGHASDRVQPARDDSVHWQVISSSATEAHSDSFSISGTLGQSVVGQSGGGTVRHGFQQSFVIGDPDCCTLRGDVDYSGDGPDIADLIFLVNFMFQDGPIPFCLGNADIDASGGTIDIADVTIMVTYMFQDGALLTACP